jgi:hypothetical protein
LEMSAAKSLKIYINKARMTRENVKDK